MPTTPASFPALALALLLLPTLTAAQATPAVTTARGETAPVTETDTTDAVLFAVDERPVMVSEFDYIYAKTNGDSADYSRASLEEYLELYRRFKLKVAAAREMGLDTVPALQQELDGYRRQLADSYLVDAEVTEPLARELHERTGTDIAIHHLSVELPDGGPGADTSAAYAKISAARERLVGGADWASVAREVSSDPSTADNGGDVGFVTAPLPPELYTLENAIYDTPTGEISPVVRSARGYHLVWVDARRPARGEVEAAHIFIRKPKAADGDSTGTADATTARARIDSIYGALQAGADFDSLAQGLSEDTRSAPRGGYIGYFGINRYERPFEDAAFALSADGDYSAPVETRVGYHIIRRVGQRQLEGYDQIRQDLMARVKRMPRFETARTAMAAELRTRYGFRENPGALDSFAAALPDSFTNYRWRPGGQQAGTLFVLGDEEATVADFNEYLRRNASQRIRYEGQASAEQAARSLYDGFLQERTDAYAERRLEVDNAPFRNLMREYREGILLFEATKQKVWDKAAQDTVGLEAFFAKHRDGYQWGERVRVDVYGFAAADSAIGAEISAFASEHSPEEVLAKFNATDSAAVTYREAALERGRDDAVDATDWGRGAATAAAPAREPGRYEVKVVAGTLPPAPKELFEARGYVIADYQDELERRWVEELLASHEVTTNEPVFEALVR